MSGLTDLDELVARCRTEQARSYVSEAVAAYRSGAYRATIISTWIATVFDIIDKLRELAIKGDAPAKKTLAEFERHQEQISRGDRTAIEVALRFERSILELARDQLQLIDQQQYVDLDRLREDRNRCAHPTFQRLTMPYVPSAELARSHLHSAVSCLLEQEAVQGKSALAELKALVESSYFPTESDKALVQLKASALARPTDALVRNFVDYLLFGFFEKGPNLRFQFRTLAALHGCMNLHRRVAEARISTQLNKIMKTIRDDDVRGSVAVVGTLPELWDMLEQSGRDKLTEFISKGPIEQIARVLQFSLKVKGLEDVSRARLNTFDDDQLGLAIAHNVGRVGVGRALDLYCHVRSWPAANTLTEKAIFPLFEFITPEHVESIIRSPSENRADLPGSTGFKRFLARVRDTGLMSAERLDALLRQYHLDYLAEDLASAGANETRL